MLALRLFGSIVAPLRMLMKVMRLEAYFRPYGITEVGKLHKKCSNFTANTSPPETSPRPKKPWSKGFRKATNS